MRTHTPRRSTRTAQLAILGALFLSACEQPVPALPPPDQMKELVVLVRPGPTTYFPGADGEPAGYDVDLLRTFAAEKKLPLRFIESDDSSHLLRDVASGGVHMGAGGLYRPPDAIGPRVREIAKRVMARVTAASIADPASVVLWSSGYYTVEATLIYNGEGYKPGNWSELDGETVAYVHGTGLTPEIDDLRRAHPGIDWKPLDVPSVEALISQVSDGSISYGQHVAYLRVAKEPIDEFQDAERK